MNVKLLLISSDDVLARAYSARCVRVGFEVASRRTAHEGLSCARQWVPDLIVLDLTLPGMHGLDVLKLLRDVPWLVKVHVVLLIERTLARDTLNECLLWGAGSYLEKDRCTLEEAVTHFQQAARSTSVATPTTHDTSG